MHTQQFQQVVLACGCVYVPDSSHKEQYQKSVLSQSRKVDQRVLATDIDAELGLITCLWDRIGQLARRSTPERSRARV